MVRGRTGSGASTRTSRRSGNVESQLSTANRPTTNMVVAIMKCSMTTVKARRAGGAMCEAAKPNAAPDSNMLIKTNSAAFVIMPIVSRRSAKSRRSSSHFAAAS